MATSTRCLASLRRRAHRTDGHRPQCPVAAPTPGPIANSQGAKHAPSCPNVLLKASQSRFSTTSRYCASSCNAGAQRLFCLRRSSSTAVARSTRLSSSACAMSSTVAQAGADCASSIRANAPAVSPARYPSCSWDWPRCSRSRRKTIARAQSRLLGFGTFEPCHALHCQVHGLYCQVLTADSLLWSRAAPSPQMRDRAGATHWRQRALRGFSPHGTHPARRSPCERREAGGGDRTR